MKALAITVCLFLFKVSVGQQWCPPGAQWAYNYYPGFDGQDGYTKINYEKDTIIDFQLCKKLGSQTLVGGYIGPGQPGPIDTFSDSPFFTLARNDTVFFLGDSGFSPFYFFGSHKGDTVSFFNNICSDTNFLQEVIDSTGTMEINNQQLRFYTASIIEPADNYIFNATNLFIERIGVPANFICLIPYCFIDGGGYSLRCYQDDSFPLYQTDTIIACDYILTSIHNLNQNPSVTLFPNPASQTFQIQFTELLYPSANFQLLDGLGRLVKQQRIKAITTTITRNNLSNGIYFWQLESGGQNYKSR